MPVKLVKLTLAFLTVFLCYWAAAGSYGAGQSGLLIWLSRTQNNAGAKDAALLLADRAISAAPQSPEAYLARGNVLQARQDYAGAEAALEQALIRRPKDYFLWLEAGRLRDSRGRAAEALAALHRAAQLAPHYADVRWQTGQVLLREGKESEGWAYLRAAALQDGTLWPGLLNLAWQLHKRQVAEAERVLKPEGAAAWWAAALFYGQHQEPAAALRAFQQIQAPSAGQRQTLQNLLLGGRYYKEARELWWQQGPGANYRGQLITNGSFETELINDPQGFSWRIRPSDGKLNLLHSTLDSRQYKEGRYSLRMDFSGAVPTDTGLVTQIIAVRPGTGYRLSFAVKTQDLVSVGLPSVVVVLDNADGRQTLAQSETLVGGTNDWRSYEVNFATGSAEALLLEVQRSCQVTPCPIFGQVWWDDFVLRETTSKR